MLTITRKQRNAKAGKCHRFEPKGSSRCSRWIHSTQKRSRKIQAISASTTRTIPKISTPKASASRPHRFNRACFPQAASREHACPRA
jgi:hypothetical protein